MGHIISKEGVATNPEKVKVVVEWLQSQTLKHYEVFWDLPVTIEGL